MPEAADYVIATPRLGLRAWREEDVAPFAAMCADPEVMLYFPATLTRDEARAAIGRYEALRERDGHSFWAVDRLDSGAFVGFVGVVRQRAEYFDWAPAYEIGWRLARAHWRQGFATEAAQACLDHAFEELNAESVYAITPEVNAPSIGVMRKLGMTLEGTFEHPEVAPESGLRRHVLYRTAL